jgi:hypothetical protein
MNSGNLLTAPRIQIYIMFVQITLQLSEINFPVNWTYKITYVPEVYIKPLLINSCIHWDYDKNNRPMRG